LRARVFQKAEFQTTTLKKSRAAADTERHRQTSKSNKRRFHRQRKKKKRYVPQQQQQRGRENNMMQTLAEVQRAAQVKHKNEAARVVRGKKQKCTTRFLASVRQFLLLFTLCWEEAGGDVFTDCRSYFSTGGGEAKERIKKKREKKGEM
jgi:hypothetical protein